MKTTPKITQKAVKELLTIDGPIMQPGSTWREIKSAILSDIARQIADRLNLLSTLGAYTWQTMTGPGCEQKILISYTTPGGEGRFTLNLDPELWTVPGVEILKMELARECCKYPNPHKFIPDPKIAKYPGPEPSHVNMGGPRQ